MYGHFCHELLRNLGWGERVIALLLCNTKLFLKYIISFNYLKVELKMYEIRLFILTNLSNTITIVYGVNYKEILNDCNCQ